MTKVITTGSATADAPSSPTPGSRLRRAAGRAAAAVIEASWLIALACLPGYLNIFSARSFEPDKAALLMVLAGTGLAAWLARVLIGGRPWLPTGEPPAEGSMTGARMVLGWTAILVASAALSTALSVSPTRSWSGSFFRQHGLATSFAWIGLGLAVAAHLRRPDQWRRLVLAVAAGSVPVGLYAVVQRLGLDSIVPLGADQRVSASLGNPLFLGGYMGMALMVTLGGLEWDEARHGGRRRTRLALAAVAILQLGAVILSQSRGPLLGLVAGLLMGALVWWRRWRDRGTRALRISPRLVVAAVGTVAVAAAVVGSVAPAGPVIQRLASSLDPTSATARVRLLIWRGVVELHTGADPLTGIDGTPDPLDRWRPVVGYGPECFDLAYNRVMPPELSALEGRGAIPDRAHCEPLDRLVTGGGLGSGAWLGLVAAVLVVAAAGASGGRSRPHLLRWWLGAMTAAAAAAAAVVVAGWPELGGLAAPGGLLAAVAWGLLRTPGDRGAARAGDPRPAVAAVVLAATSCHLVELSFGFPVTATAVTWWVLVGALVATSAGLTAQTADRPSAGGWLADALLAGTAVAVATGSLVDRSAGELTTRLATAVSESARAVLAAAGAAPLVGTAGVLAVALLAWSFRPVAAPGRPDIGRWLIAAAAPLALAVGARWVVLERIAVLGRQGADLESLAIAVAGIAGVAVAVIVALLLTLAAALARGRLSGARDDGNRNGVTAAVGGSLVVLFVALSASLVAGRVLRPVRADTLAKHAGIALENGQPVQAVRLASQASWLAPAEPALLTPVARTVIVAARAAASPATQRAAVETGAHALGEAAHLQPYDPDHAVNLGRVLAAAASLAPDPDHRRELLARAEEMTRRALEMRPGSLVFAADLAGLEARLGRVEEAVARLERVLTYEPDDEVAAIMLAGLEYSRAETAQREERPRAATRHLEAAVKPLEVLLAHRLEHPRAERAIGSLYVRLGRRAEATEILEGLVDGTEAAAVRELLALLHLEAGRPEAALRHAEAAIRRAAPDGRPRAAAILGQARRRLEADASRQPAP